MTVLISKPHEQIIEFQITTFLYEILIGGLRSNNTLDKELNKFTVKIDAFEINFKIKLINS